MKLTSLDLETLQRAADVADAQRQLLELMKRRPDGTMPPRWRPNPAFLLAAAALAVLSVLTLNSLA
jgi:hypothetical protein